MEDPDHAMEAGGAVIPPAGLAPARELTDLRGNVGGATRASGIDIEALVSLILNRRRGTPPARALLVGISGIDGAGKGFVAGKVAAELRRNGWNPAVIHADRWLNLPHVRFNAENPGLHFYRHALRLNEMFGGLVLPLKANRWVEVEADFATEAAERFRRRLYSYRDVDVVLVEGIYLFRRDLQSYFDLKIWLDCSFETALDRAVARGQEGLSPDQTIAAYQRIYFPAQRVHAVTDWPKEAADLVVPNDPRLLL